MDNLKTVIKFIILDNIAFTNDANIDTINKFITGKGTI